MQRPDASEFHEFYSGYVNEVPAGTGVIDYLRAQQSSTDAFLGELSEEQRALRYAEDKWSIRQLIAHIIDGERMFAFRAMTFARGDTTELPGFDEQIYAHANRADERTLASLAAELRDLRASHVAMFEHLNDEECRRSGVANGTPVSVRALAAIIGGHQAHHLDVIRERYL